VLRSKQKLLWQRQKVTRRWLSWPVSTMFIPASSPNGKSSTYGVAKPLLESLPEIFSRSRQKDGHAIPRGRVRRLMRQMGLEAVYPRRKRGLSIPDKQHKIYPYLLRNVQIIRPDQVWSADITYIRMCRGWLYLVAVMDWFSRYVLSWEISITLESQFAVSALQQALNFGKPDIFNTDQGSQFTSIDFTQVLLDAGVQISMDGKGRVFDNIFVERLWRTVKVEEVYLRDYQTVAEAAYGLGRYFEFYNNQRLHQALGYRTPAEVYGVAVGTPVATTGSLRSNGSNIRR